MRIDIYTLAKEDLEKMRAVLPDYVLKKTEHSGCFTLGAVIQEKGKDVLAGMCQFFVNLTPTGTPLAELVYVYVYEGYRRTGIGTRLLEKMARILEKSGVRTSVSLLLMEEAKTLGYSFSEKELEKFLKEGGYLPAKEDPDLWGMVERDLFAGIPGILVRGTKKYIKYNDR